MIGDHARDHCERRTAATLCRQRGLPPWRESCARRALSGFHALTFFRLPAPFARQCSCRRVMVVARPDTRRTDERRVRARCALVIGMHIPQPPHALTRRAGSVEASNWSARASITDLLGANSVGQARVELWSGSRVRCRPAPKLPRSNAFTLEGEGARTRLGGRTAVMLGPCEPVTLWAHRRRQARYAFYRVTGAL
jgi:hypothetical protein